MSYYLLIDGEQVGPVEIESVAGMVERGEIGRDTLAWTAGMKDWAPIADIGELASLFDPANMPPPVLGGPVGGTDQPLDIERVFKTTFAEYKRQFWPAFLVSFIYNLISSGFLILVFGMAAVVGAGTGETEPGAQIVQFSLIGIALMMVVMPILYGGLSVAMLNLVRGQTVQPNQLFSALPRAVTLVAFWWLYAIACALGFLFFVVPALLIAATFMLTPFVIMESRLGPIDAMKAGFRAVMSLGWWRCVLLLAVLLIAIFLVAVVTEALVLALGSALIAYILTLLVNSLATVVMVGSLAAAYEQARANQERTTASGNV